MANTLLNQGIPVVGPLLNKLIGTRNERFVKKYTTRAAQIDALEEQVRPLSDGEIRGMVAEFRERIKRGEAAMDVMVEAFAVAREAMDRHVGIRNIFNPAMNFDTSKLPADVRDLYEKTRAEMDSLEPREPTGDLAGSPGPVPAWQWVDIPTEVYAAVRELYPESRPPFRARPFDVQLIGAMVLYQGKIAEMKTGEGKTIVAPLACYLACIEGLTVHVVTVNDYLVQRDRDWVFPFFRGLGLTVGAIHPHHMQPEQVKRDMYQCDVVYGTTSEFGFDYLRDNMKRRVEEQVQRGRHFAIVDEVDSILIDEARTPLIISGPAHEDVPRYDLADKIARHLVERQRAWQQADDRVQECKRLVKGLEGDIRNAREKSKVPELQQKLRAAKHELPTLEATRDTHMQYYDVQLERKQCHLTHQGIAEAQKSAGIGSFYVGENMDVPHLLENALRSHVVYQRDRDYIVMPMQNPQTGRQEPSIVIVDVNTGRPMIGRQWSDGLHQAVEAKEAVPIKQENQTVATVTIQNYYKMYRRLAGMTGTADTEAQEFHDIYHLDVVSIPTNKPVTRADFDDLMFLREKDKWEAIVDEIRRMHDIGRPVLVGTTSVEKSETLAQMLWKKHQIKHEVLNAKQHEREAHIIEGAGGLGAVMIATNMAGRGTDIKLGTLAREQLLDHWLRRSMCSRELAVTATQEQLRENVYRKIAPKELEVQKREAEEMPFADLELALLREWAMRYTWASPKKVASMPAGELREELDKTGRSLLHRIRWYDNIEDLGGLHVIGTERHESRRIDNQLRGRSGRQGDKGSSRFFVSLEDDLMKMFAGETTMRILSRLGMKEGDAIEHPILSKSVARAQKKVEERNFHIRKNILEYDEVMEHQRQYFYGLRQRVLEGRDCRGVVFDFILEAVEDAVGEYLDKNYAAECAAEYARQVLDYPIAPERLRDREVNDMIDRIRQDALNEARAQISLTIGEFIPEAGSEVQIDLDAEGLAQWAKNSFGVELDRSKLADETTRDRRAIEGLLLEAAQARIEATDLSGVVKFAAKDYGASELVKWAEGKFEIKLGAPAVMAAHAESGEQAVVDMIIGEARKKYTNLEIEYPVDYRMTIAMNAMRQNPDVGMQQLISWANRRYGLGWTPETLKTIPPQKAREQLVEASRRFIESGDLEKEREEAVAAATSFESLAKHFEERYASALPDRLRRQPAQDLREAAVAQVDAERRLEMLFLERTMCVEVFDSTWHSHLYAIDQLRDAIWFRAVSQQDPKIAFKREGSRLFSDMMSSVRERVTDYIFKMKLMPTGQRAGAAAAPPRAPSPAPAAAGLTYGAGMITGPGLDGGGSGRPAPLPPGTPAPAPSTSGSSSPEGSQPRQHQPAAADGRDAADKSTKPPAIRGKKRRR